MDKKDTSEVDATALLPPIETFMKVDQDDRASHFFDVVSTFDILLCRVIIILSTHYGKYAILLLHRFCHSVEKQFTVTKKNFVKSAL